MPDNRIEQPGRGRTLGRHLISEGRLKHTVGKDISDLRCVVDGLAFSQPLTDNCGRDPDGGENDRSGESELQDESPYRQWLFGPGASMARTR